MKNRKLTRRDTNEAGISLIMFVIVGLMSFTLWYVLAKSWNYDSNLFEFLGGAIIIVISLFLTGLTIVTPFNFYSALFGEEAWYLFTHDDDYKDKKKVKPKKK